jgi:predicted metal-dependent RNase
LNFIESYEESKSLIESRSDSIIISSSAFAQGGRILAHFTTVLPDEKATLVTIGYSSPDSNMGQIKRGQSIKIMNDGKLKSYEPKCKIVELTSYSSHMQSPQLLWYYSSLNCNQIVLQHGELSRKLEFAEELDKELKRQCKTTKVIVPNRKDRLEI